jgi:hypothetical protein
MATAKNKAGGGARMAMMVGAAVVVLVGGSLVAMSVMRANAHDADDAQAYALSGAPCPTTTPARLAVEGPKPRHTFEYGGLSLSHASGEADCAWIKGPGGFMGFGGTKYPVCRFSGPGSLEVKDGTSDLLFAPLIGKEVAVVKEGAQLKCVVAPRNGA